MVVAFRDAPEDEDEESLTAEEEAALEQSHEEYRRGEAVPLDEIRHEFSFGERLRTRGRCVIMDAHTLRRAQARA